MLLQFDLDRGIAAGTLEEDESVLIKSEPEDEARSCSLACSCLLHAVVVGHSY